MSSDQEAIIYQWGVPNPENEKLNSGFIFICWEFEPINGDVIEGEGLGNDVANEELKEDFGVAGELIKYMKN